MVAVNEREEKEAQVIIEEMPALEVIPEPVITKAKGPGIDILFCPLCNKVMPLRRAHKGGCFYGCSQWPACKGYRNKHNKGPGPAAMIIQLRKMYGDAVWKEMEDMRRAGKSPFNHS